MVTSDFIKERNEALFSLDKKRIMEYMARYDVPIPINDRVFWGGVHGAILVITAATEEQKEHSRKWLSDNGFLTGDEENDS